MYQPDATRHANMTMGKTQAAPLSKASERKELINGDQRHARQRQQDTRLSTVGAAFARPRHIGEINGKARIEDASGKSKHGLAKIEDRSDGEIESTRCLTKGFQRGEDDDIQKRTDDAADVDEQSDVDIHLLNDEVYVNDSEYGGHGYTETGNFTLLQSVVI